MTVETVTFISDLDQNNPAGGDSIAEGDDHIRNIKKAIQATFPNINEAVTTTAEDLNKLSDFVSGGNGVFASCKFNGTNLMYGHNVSSINVMSNAAYRINFVQPTDGFDHHYAVQLTMIATNGRPVIGQITDQRDSYVDFTARELSGSSDWVTPSGPLGFYMTMVDMIQTEANANT
jgi:hypothetical protein